MAKELAQTIGAKRIGLLIAVLAAFAVLATMGNQWFSKQAPLPSTTGETATVVIVVPDGYQLMYRAIPSTTGEVTFVGVLVPEDQNLMEHAASIVQLTGTIVYAMTQPRQEVFEPSQPSLRPLSHVPFGQQVFASVDSAFERYALSLSDRSVSDKSVSIVGDTINGITSLLALDIICEDTRVLVSGQEDGLREAMALESRVPATPRWVRNVALDISYDRFAAVMSTLAESMTQPQDKHKL